MHDLICFTNSLKEVRRLVKGQIKVVARMFLDDFPPLLGSDPVPRLLSSTSSSLTPHPSRILKLISLEGAS
jgi:hypothetical protein